MNLWPNQQHFMEEVPRRILAGDRKICVTSPTGGGKGRMISDLIEWGVGHEWHVALYANRKLLIEQLSRVLSERGVRFGIRAAGHQDLRERVVQISSLPTERSRVLGDGGWDIHGQGSRVLALVDEAHLNKSDTAQKILARHLEDGGAYVGFTATPIDLAHLYDQLVVCGTPSEMRGCGALVPAYHFGPDEPDMKNFKPQVKTGEFSEGQVRKAIMTKCIFARVWEHYEVLNADRRPTILFAPGVGESLWFAQQFESKGVPWAHIDANCIWLDGAEHKSTSDLRQEVIARLKDGRLKGVSNRFVLREGIDIPVCSHAILATVFGSLQSYLQSCGRILRAAPGKDRATIQDHGGHWWRHGSVNMDRQWNLGLTENMISGLRGDSLREKKQPEPIRCPKCGMIRAKGPKCHSCGFESTKKSRVVVQTDGRLTEHVGDIFKPRRVRLHSDTQKNWTSMYYRAMRSRTRMTFNQAAGLFAHEKYYWPPRDLPLMPKEALDWYLPVADVPRERLL